MQFLVFFSLLYLMMQVVKKNYFQRNYHAGVEFYANRRELLRSQKEQSSISTQKISEIPLKYDIFVFYFYPNSLHPYFELSNFNIRFPTPVPLYCISIEFPLIQYVMLSNILLFKSYSSCIVIKTTFQIKLSICIGTLTFYVSMRNWMNVKFVEQHRMLFFRLFIGLNIKTCPLTSLGEVRHYQFYELLQFKVIEISKHSSRKMGSSPSNQSKIIPQNSGNNQNKKDPLISNEVVAKQGPKILMVIPIKIDYKIPQLQKVIIKAHKDLHSKDPIGKKRYFFQIVNFIFQWLRQSMQKGSTLYDAQCLVIEDLKLACKQYPIGKIQDFVCNIKDLKPQKMPNLLEGVQNITKQTFTDRVRQLCIRSKKVSYQFNKQMQLILQKFGGFKFKANYKNTGTKAYMRILTKILQNFFSNTDGSKQVYLDMNHYFWTPIFVYFNKIIDQNINKLKIQVYDWIRCRVFYKTIQELQQAYERLNSKYRDSIFRVKNRMNTHTRDILINLKYQTEYAQIQLALSYQSSSYQFNHKLYELTRQKLGVAYSCFTILLNQISQEEANVAGVQTESGYIKRTLLRENVDEGFQRLTLQDAKRQSASIQKLLQEWDIVALKTGTIKGPAFDQKISTQNYGPQISQMMIIKRKSKDYLDNWLNWLA